MEKDKKIGVILVTSKETRQVVEEIYCDIEEQDLIEFVGELREAFGEGYSYGLVFKIDDPWDLWEWEEGTA